MASSRVGDKMSAKCSCGLSMSACRMGSENAPVLPLPVWARPMTSWPVCACLGVRVSVRRVVKAKGESGDGLKRMARGFVRGLRRELWWKLVSGGGAGPG